MIRNTFDETFSQEWINKNLPDPTNELVLFQKIIPWEKLVKQLSQFYSKKDGPFGKSIRVVVAILILAKLRLLSDVKVILDVQVFSHPL